ILRREMPEQILLDGMHFERSPMYHVRILYLLRLLHDTGNEELAALVDAPLEQLEIALVKLTHPDGQIALFNDSAFGICNEPTELIEQERFLLPGAWSLPYAGYYGWRGTDGTYLIC